jgi:asparagine synthase (glutamine-hydrolysing)
MIGVFALAGWSPAELQDHARNLAVKMAAKPAWQVGTSVTDDVACGRIGPPRSEAVWSSEDGVYQAWLDGFAWSLSSQDGEIDRVVGVGDLAQALLSRGPEALLDFQGEFCLLVFDRAKRTLLAATDRFGIRTTYWHAAAGRLAICSELYSLLHLGLVPRQLDKPFVAALLRFNKCRLGDKTLFAGIEVVPPGTVLEFDLNQPTRPKRHLYYQHTFYDEAKSEADWVNDIVPALRGAVQDAVNRHEASTALLLSGGLDSRLLLSALDADQRKQLFLVSCGLPESDEVQLAAQVAAQVGGNYRNIDLGPADYLEWAQTHVRRNEEFDIFVQGAQAQVHEEAAKAVIAATTGWDLDIPLRGTYLDQAALSLTDEALVKDLIDAKWKLFSEAELAELLQEPFYREAGQAPEGWLDELLAQLPARTPLRLYLQFIFQYEKRRLLMLRGRMMRFELETMTPFYNTRLQLLLSRVPEHMKENNRLFARVLNELSPELAAIPYQRTMLPANIPVEYWERGTELENQREALLREIYTKTGIRVPYRRYYSNFDEWLASDLGWLRFARDLLDSKETLLTQELVRPDVVGRFLEAYSGKSSQRLKLIYLMSLELYLREYFN